MGEKCKDVEYLDMLTKQCTHCKKNCQSSPTVPRCSNYCVSAKCRAKPGHYYDILLKNCTRCPDKCGRHPAECSQHCSTLPPPVSMKRLLPEVTKQTPNVITQPSLDDTTILMYSLLAVCTALLFSSLCLVFVLILKVAKPRSSDKGPSPDNDHKQKCAVQLEQKFDFPGNQAGRNSKDFLTTSSNPTYREPSDDSSPTETCVCVHCFPDLRIFGQDSQTPPREPESFHQQTVFHTAQVQEGGSVFNKESLYGSGLNVQEEAAVG